MKIHFLICTLFLNALLFGQEEKESKWTCSMHPQIIKEKSRECPICLMDLVPLPYEEILTCSKIWSCSMHPQIILDELGVCSICGMELSEIEPSKWGVSKREHLILTEEMMKKSQLSSEPIEEKIEKGTLTLMVPESAILLHPKNKKIAIIFLKILNFPAIWICETHPQKAKNSTGVCDECSQPLIMIEAYYTIEKRFILLGEKSGKWYKVHAGLERKKRNDY